MQEWKSIHHLLQQAEVRPRPYGRRLPKGWKVYDDLIIHQPQTTAPGIKMPRLFFESAIWVLESTLASGVIKHVYMISDEDSNLISFKDTDVTPENWRHVWSTARLEQTSDAIKQVAANPRNVLKDFASAFLPKRRH